ncbi:MAG: hypothetical protein KDD37_10035 [Bdellovibrionales bacterium]|nr:hypothetical protein [Bdellovibrionales bacterium]
MGNLLFVIKTFVLSLLLILVLQVKWGEKSIDDLVYFEMKSSTILSPINEVASGGALWVKNTFRGFSSMFTDKLKNQIDQTDAAGNRRLPEIKRHFDASKEKAKQARSRFTNWMNDEVKEEKPSDIISE